MNLELFPCIRFEPPLPECCNNVGVTGGIAGRSLGDHLQDATRVNVKYQTEKTCYDRVLCAKRLRIMRLFEVSNVVRPDR
jgi:hypothetical protein